jgi:ABC-type glutathione transport system ATPase component
MTATVSADPVLRIDQLSLSFVGDGGEVHALRGVSLAVGPGEIVGLVGESGSGKSVTALNILRLLPAGRTRVAAESTVAVLGRDVLAFKDADLRQLRGGEVSMIFQEPMTALNPVLTVGRQIVDVIRRHLAVSAAQARAQSLGLLRDMKIDDPERVFGAYPHELSGGMRQRVLIAMAFSCRPKLILADEPTTALDVTVQAQILALLKERARETGTAVLLISHDLAVVAELCDRVYVMRGGEIVEDGATAAVIRRPQHPYTQALLAALPEGKAPKSRLFAPQAKAPSPHPSPRGGAGVIHSVRPLLEIEGVSARYPSDFDVLGRPRGHTVAVNNVTLALNAGETLSLVGESGSGKTSLANAIVGLAPVSAGAIRYKGQDLGTANAATRREIQMVFQDPRGSLDPRWPAWRIVTEPLTVERGHARNALREAATDLLRQVGLDTTMLDRLPHEFSGGQRQRLAIARALAVRPQLLVLDEPTSALDVSVQAQILDLLLDLQDAHGLSYLFISHNVAVVRHISDKVAVMYRAEVVESGLAHDVLSQPREAYTRALLDAVPHLNPVEETSAHA